MKHDNIPEWPGYYISKSGKVYSRFIRGSRVLGSSWNLLKSHKRPKYLNVTLHNQKQVGRFYIHRLVAMVYIPNPNNLPIVMHLDNNIYNNHVSNLKWGTQKENLEQAISEQRSFAFVPNDDRQPARKISLKQEQLIRKAWDNHIKTIKNPKKYIKDFIRNQANLYEVGDRTIRKILQNRKDQPIYSIPLDDIKSDLKNGLSRKEICKRYEISKTTLRKWLKNDNKPI
jgi:hypothetical protein|nr:MAG TPA: homing endonuclease [Caudoviricetes sp.]